MAKIDYNTNYFEKLKMSELKKIADYWLRKYLLKKAKKNSKGQIWCPIKKKFYNKSKINASHFIDRACMNLRYSTKNVHLLSEQSNMWDSKVMVGGYKSKHHKDFEEFLGDDLVRYLEKESDKIKILRRPDFVDIIKNFRDE